MRVRIAPSFFESLQNLPIEDRVAVMDVVKAMTNMTHEELMAASEPVEIVIPDLEPGEDS